MREIIRNGLRFPTGPDDFQPSPELGEELVRLNQELLDAKDRPASEVPAPARRIESEASRDS